MKNHKKVQKLCECSKTQISMVVWVPISQMELNTVTKCLKSKLMQIIHTVVINC